jgi:hypothetical protein
VLKLLATALVAAGALAVATPAAFACPGMEKEKTAGEKTEAAPKTADNPLGGHETSVMVFPIP